MKKTMIRIYAFILAITIIAGILAGITNVKISKTEEKENIECLTFDEGKERKNAI